MKSGARILIAGCGYVGCAAAERLRDAGHIVFGARRDVSQLPAGVRPVEIDLLGADLGRIPERLDAVVWALAPTPGEAGYQAAYVDAPRRLLTLLAERNDPIERAVLVGSTSVWHREGGEWIDESSPANPVDYRGRSVLAGERAFADSGFSAVGLRFAGIYGPGRTRMLDLVAAGQAAPPQQAVFGNRIWRDDGAKAIVHTLSLADPAPIYTVVDDDPADLRDVYAWLARRTGATLPAATADFRGRGGNKRCRNHLLRASGWHPDVTDYQSGYARMLESR